MTEDEDKSFEKQLEFHAKELKRKSHEVRNLSTLCNKAISEGASVSVTAEEDDDRIHIYIRAPELTDTLRTISKMCSMSNVVEYDYDEDVFIIKEKYLLY